MADVNMRVPAPKDVLAVIEMIESQRPGRSGRGATMTEGQLMLIEAGYDLVHDIMMYAYYCSLRDGYSHANDQ